MWRTTSVDARKRGQEAADGRRLLLAWVPLVAVVTIMCSVCLLCNAPHSPLRSALAQRADAVLDAWYGQRWDPFGPQEPDDTWQVVLRARFAHRPGEPDTREWDLSEEIRSSRGAHPLHQSKEGHVLNCFGAHALGARPAGRPPEAPGPEPDDPGLRALRSHCADASLAPAHRGLEAPLWDRYFSRHARELAGGERKIEAFRVRVLTGNAVQPGGGGGGGDGERAGGGASRGGPAHDTGWRPYVPVGTR